MQWREGKRGSHRAPCGEKSGACQGATQVVVGVAMTAGKLRAAELEDGSYLSHGKAATEKMAGHPQVDNAPVGRAETLGNPPSAQAIPIGGGGVCGGDRCRRGRRRIRCMGRRPGWSYPVAGRLQQGIGVGSQPGTGMQDPDPRRAAEAITMAGFPIGETSQSAQVTPVGASQVSGVLAGQEFGHGGGQARFQRAAANLHPSLQVAGTGLNYQAGIMPISAHSIQHIDRGAIQVDQNIAGVLVPAIRVNVDVVSFPVVGAEKRDSGRAEQLRCAPQAPPRQWLPGLIVNQTNQIQVMRHGRQVPANGLGGEQKAVIGHTRSMDRGGLCYKGFSGSSRCAIPPVSQIWAQSSG